MAKKYTYDVFVSHNSKDKPWVRRFVSILKNLGIQTFFDESEIKFGENIPEAVMRAEAKSRIFLLIISPESTRSPWVRAEYLVRLYTSPDGRKRTLIPILLKKTNSNKIPSFIKLLKYVDLSDNTKRKDEWEMLLRQLIGVTAQVIPEMPNPDDLYTLSTDQTPPVSNTVPSIFLTQSQSQKHITVIGMGYTGTLLASCLANIGHSVVGVEENESKIDTLSNGRSHLLEPGINALVKRAWESKKLTITHSFSQEIAAITEFVVVCVGPNKHQNSETWDRSRFKSVLEEIGNAIHKRKSLVPLNIIIAATIRPQDCTKNILEEYLRINDSHSDRFIVATSPLFFREGSMIADLQNPPFIITGTFDGKPNKASFEWSEILLSLAIPTAKNNTKLQCLTTGMAAMVKLSSNTFHAMKVCFANEVGRICHEHNIDSHAVMEVFNQDYKLNISDLYLKPGFAFGGSCLGKDIHGLLSTSEKYSKETFRLINSVQASNNVHIQQAAQIIINQAEPIGIVGFLGLTFKAGTDDVRSSPAIELINRLPRNYDISAFDHDLLRTPGFTGKNKSQWKEVIDKHKIDLVKDIEMMLSNCFLIVIAKPSAIDYNELLPLLSNQHCIIDLTGEISSMSNLPCKLFTLV